MLNAERFKKEILENSNAVFDFSMSKDKHTIKKCLGVCDDCFFHEAGNHCSNIKVKWLLSEYKEPVKLTRFEYFILDWLLNSQCVRYIARDRNGNLYAHINKPCRVKYEWRGNVSAADLTIFSELFAFVKWQNTEPTPIKDVLDNCEVVESDL